MAKIFTPSKNKNRQHKSKSKQLANFVAKVENYDPKGKAIVSGPGNRIGFIKGALLNEEVKIRPIKYTDKVIEGDILEVLTASPDRISAKCPHFKSCGGCQLQMMDTAHQLQAKQNAVNDMLCNKLSVKDIPWQPSVSIDDWHYRRSARLSIWHENDGQVTFGFRQTNSKQIIDIEQCPVLEKSIEQRLISLKQQLTALKDKKCVTHIQAVYSNEGVTFILRATTRLTTTSLSALKSWASGSNCNIFAEYEDKQYQTIHKSNGDSNAVLSYQLDELKFEFFPHNFIQVNDKVNQAMVQQALNWLDVKQDENVLDLFSGIGNFTLPLAQKAKQVFAVEGVMDMVRQLQHNAKINGIDNISAHQADLSQLSEKQKPKWLRPIDKLLLDPARDGAFAVVKKIPLLNPNAILYVSCEPTTMQRDIKELLNAGYVLSKFTLLNMFPHTQHTEAMALLTKK